MNNTKPSGPPTVSPYPSEAPSRTPAPSSAPTSSSAPSRSPDRSSAPSSAPSSKTDPSSPPSESSAPSRSPDRSSAPSSSPAPSSKTDPSSAPSETSRPPDRSSAPSSSPAPSSKTDSSNSPVSPTSPRVYFQATPSALPSHWAYPSGTAGTGATGTPPTLSFSFGITGANGTALVQGPLLQQLQAALGCTFLVPLENVVLTNVTAISGGVGTLIPFDRSIPTLKSNGSVVCLVPLNGGRLLRSRRAQTTSTVVTVVIGVEILSPSASLVLLNATELNALLEDSTVLQLVSVASGGSGLSLLSAEGVAATGAATGATGATGSTTGSAVTGTASSPNIGLIVGLSVLSGFCVAVAGVVAGLYYRARTKPIRSRVILVENAFSEPGTGSAGSASLAGKQGVLEDRVEFSPLSIRQPLV